MRVVPGVFLSAAVGILSAIPIFTSAAVVYSQPDISSVVGNGRINGFTLLKFGGENNTFDAPNGLSSIEMYGQASTTATIRITVTCRSTYSTFNANLCGDEWSGGKNILIATGTIPTLSPDYFSLSIATSVPFRAVASNNPLIPYYYFFVANISNVTNVQFYGTSTPNLCQIGCGTGYEWRGNPYFIFTAGANALPTISNLGQFRQFGEEAIAEGETFIGNAAVFKGTVADADGDQVRFEVEIKPVDVPFDAIGTYVTSLTEQGEIVIPVDELIEPPEQTPEGGYVNAFRWRARAIDENENASEWQEFGTPGNTDFVAHYTLGQAASDLAKQVVDQPDGYELGARGWLYNANRFATSEEIINGYTYRSGLTGNLATSSGIDCSGLLYWSFNKSNSPHATTSYGNYVADITANGIFEEDKQSDPVSESELKPGDALFFDYDSDPQMDHVAMYVGESGGYDVVNASSEATGITSESKDILKNSLAFEDYRRIHRNGFEGHIKSGSPVNLIVTDPDGNTLSFSDVIQSEEEFIREVPGELYYSEIQKSDDGNPIDVVYLPTLKEGAYTIDVIPNPNAGPEETYSLEFTAGNETVILAQDVPLAQIPENGYQVNVGPDEEISIVKNLDASADTYIKAGTPNKNQGTENILRVRAAGDNRALVKFDLSEIPQSAVISSAKLVLDIAYNKDNWGSDGRVVGVHMMTKDWTELGATWNCGIDSNTLNSNANDCNGTNWEMGKPLQPQLWPYAAMPQATTTVANGQLGEIEFDVTTDVQQFVAGITANHGWLVRKQKEGASGHVEFMSRETEKGPRLIITYQ